MVRSVFLILLLAVALVPAAPGPAHGCSCATPAVSEAVEHADVVVTGRLTGARLDGRFGDQVVYEFTPSELHKGEGRPVVEVRSASSGSACGLGRMVAGRTYVVFAHEHRRELVAGLCGGTAPAAAPYVERVRRVTDMAAVADRSMVPRQRVAPGWWLMAGTGGVFVATLAVLVVRRRWRSSSRS